jgi:hypothetical protein
MWIVCGIISLDAAPVLPWRRSTLRTLQHTPWLSIGPTGKSRKAYANVFCATYTPTRSSLLTAAAKSLWFHTSVYKTPCKSIHIRQHELGYHVRFGVKMSMVISGSWRRAVLQVVTNVSEELIAIIFTSVLKIGAIISSNPLLDVRWSSSNGGSARCKAGLPNTEKRGHASLPWVEFEPTIRVFETHVLDRVATGRHA